MNLSWYLDTPEKVYQYLLDYSKKKYHKILPYIEYLITYELSWRLVYNKNFKMSKTNKEKYIKLLDDLIKLISLYYDIKNNCPQIKITGIVNFDPYYENLKIYNFILLRT